MQYSALATDFDGTIAQDGVVDDATLAALQRWRGVDRQIILITGRRLDDFLTIFTPIELFDLVVAENGAALYFPGDRNVKLLADPPPQAFIDQLQDRIAQSDPPESISGEFSQLAGKYGLGGLEIGRVIVATWVPHDVTAQQLIQEQALDLQIIMNKGAVMILPTEVDKASGLKTALQELDLDPQTVVGVGDAENDLPFLNLCGHSVAVANALPALKQQVDFVTQGSRGAGVAELIDRLIELQST